MFPINRLFRDKVLKRLGRTEPLDTPLQVTAPHEWMFLLFAGIALLGLSAWGVFGSVEFDASAQCVLARPGERYPVSSPHDGVLIEILAQDGDLVEDDEPLARLTAPDLHMQTRIARTRVALLEEQIAAGETGATEALRTAQAQALEREAEEAAGTLLVSPRTGELSGFGVKRGTSVVAGERLGIVRVGPDDQIEALAYLNAHEAERVEVGLTTGQVLVESPDGAAPIPLPARILEISPRPMTPPEWLTAIAATTLEPGYQVRLGIDPSAAEAAGPTPDGAGCQARLLLGRHAPVNLLAPPGSR